jgi:hypothetical protein
MVGDVDVAAAALELYGLPPEEFTAARNQVVKQTKDAGDAGSSAALKALRKPTLAAWLANLLVRVDPDGIDELTDLGEELRQAHVSRDGRRLRELTLRRHGLVHKLVTAARTQARARGHTVSAPTGQRLTETLDAAVIDPGAAQLLRTGQLTSALRHVGFGVVDETGDPAQLAPIKPHVVRTSPPKPPRKATTRRTPQSTPAAAAARHRRTELRTRAEHAEREYAEAETERAQAQAALDAHEHHLADLEVAIERLTEELEHARQQLRDANHRTRALQVELNRTTRNATVAQQRRDANQQRLADLDR